MVAATVVQKAVPTVAQMVERWAELRAAHWAER